MPGHLAYIPGSGLYSAALAEFYNRAVNRYGGLASVAPAFAALEESVIRWMAHEVCGLPEGSGGLLTSGGSMATFSATVAARHDRLGEDLAGGTVYTTAFAHHSVAKAARLAGIPATHIRTVPHTPDLRMDPQAAAAMIRERPLAGLAETIRVSAARRRPCRLSAPRGGFAIMSAACGPCRNQVFRLSAPGPVSAAGQLGS